MTTEEQDILQAAAMEVKLRRMIVINGRLDQLEDLIEKRKGA